MSARVWNILVHSYGSFQVTGTREEAEQAKSDKCNWEQSAGRLWADEPQTEVERLEKAVGEQFRDHRSCPLSLIKRLSAAKEQVAPVQEAMS